MIRTLDLTLNGMGKHWKVLNREVSTNIRRATIYFSKAGKKFHLVYSQHGASDIQGIVPMWRRQWHPTPVLLPGKFHGWRSLLGYSPWDLKELDTTEEFHWFPGLVILFMISSSFLLFLRTLKLSIT